MLNQEIAAIFRKMALFFQMQDDGFRARAYENGAEILENLTLNVKDVYAKKGLKGLEDLHGIGRGMAEKIEEYIKTGKIKEYGDLKKKMPVDIDELASVEGLGPMSIKTLYKKLKIKNLEDLFGRNHKYKKTELNSEDYPEYIISNINLFKNYIS